MLKNFTEKYSQIRLGGYKKLSASYISLFLVFLLLVTTTVSWFTRQDTASVDSDTFKLNASSGLRVNEGEDLENHIKLDNLMLSEASSVDGRNMFFPAEGNFSSQTSGMKFREGNVGDKNVLYAHKNFTLQGDSSITYVYVKSYMIKVKRKVDGQSEPIEEVFDGSLKMTYDKNNSRLPVGQIFHKECPVRIAFIQDSSITPNVIDPRALVDDYVINYDAVAATDTNGSPYTQQTNAKSFSDFYYGTGSPLFTLENGKPITASMVVWLEGTSDELKQYRGQEISVDIELESNWTQMHAVEFIDDTLGSNNEPEHWIDEKENEKILIIMSYRDVEASTSTRDVWKSVIMQKNGTTDNGNKKWLAYLPNNVTTNISFYRCMAKDNEVVYNSWHTMPDLKSLIIPQKGKNWYEVIFGSEGSQDHRTTDGTENGSLYYSYTARHDNGYGKVEGTDDNPETQRKRLAPCIGYWGTPTSQGGSGESGGGSEETQEFTIGQIELSQVTSQKTNSDVYEMLQNGASLYLEFSNGNRIQLELGNNTDYYKATNQKVNKYDIIKRFIVSDGTTVKGIALESGEITITTNNNLNFYMNDQGQAVANFTQS